MKKGGMRRVSAEDARKNLGDILACAAYAGEWTMICKHNKPMAVVVPPDVAKRLAADKER